MTNKKKLLLGVFTATILLFTAENADAGRDHHHGYDNHHHKKHHGYHKKHRKHYKHYGKHWKKHHKYHHKHHHSSRHHYGHKHSKFCKHSLFHRGYYDHGYYPYKSGLIIRNIFSSPDNSSINNINTVSDTTSYVADSGQTYSDSGEYCREYQSNVTVNNEKHESYGKACLQPDGSWKIVN